MEEKEAEEEYFGAFNLLWNPVVVMLTNGRDWIYYDDLGKTRNDGAGGISSSSAADGWRQYLFFWWLW